MDKLSVYKKYFETAKDDTHLVMHRGYALALVSMVEQLRAGKLELERRLEFAEEQLEQLEEEEDGFHFER
jgi:hypothetical protein